MVQKPSSCSTSESHLGHLELIFSLSGAMGSEIFLTDDSALTNGGETCKSANISKDSLKEMASRIADSICNLLRSLSLGSSMEAVRDS